jgi:hypothetical protein
MIKKDNEPAVRILPPVYTPQEKLAMKLFKQASIACPASIVAQSAYMAKEVKKKPELLRGLNAITHNPNIIADLVDAAHIVHERAQANVERAHVNPGKMVSILTDEVGLVERMSRHLAEKDLDIILSLNPQDSDLETEYRIQATARFPKIDSLV